MASTRDLSRSKTAPDNEITKSGLGVVGTLLQGQSAGEKSQADWA